MDENAPTCTVRISLLHSPREPPPATECVNSSRASAHPSPAMLFANCIQCVTSALLLLSRSPHAVPNRATRHFAETVSSNSRSTTSSTALHRTRLSLQRLPPHRKLFVCRFRWRLRCRSSSPTTLPRPRQHKNARGTCNHRRRRRRYRRRLRSIGHPLATTSPRRRPQRPTLLYPEQRRFLQPRSVSSTRSIVLQPSTLRCPPPAHSLPITTPLRPVCTTGAVSPCHHRPHRRSRSRSHPRTRTGFRRRRRPSGGKGPRFRR